MSTYPAADAKWLVDPSGAFLTTLPTRHVALLLDYALHVHEVER